MNPSTVLARVLVDALAGLGVRHAVLCPGSRSSALAYALAAADSVPAPAGGTGPADGTAPADGMGPDGGTGPDGGGSPGSRWWPRGQLQLHVRVDERSAGFLALGLAKETAVAAVVVTTSGTAVANLHPAVLEASHAGVPLLVLSADRPHELRGTGANQTTDQVKLFGDAVRLFLEIPAPQPVAAGESVAEGKVPAWQVRSWRAAVSRALAAARGERSARPGPVHVNVAFREPLVPDDGPDEPDGQEAPDGAGAGRGRWPHPPTGGTGLTRVVAPAPGGADPVWLPDGPRTVVLAGDGAGAIAADVAAGGDWPLLAEPSSGARFGPLAIGPYRLLLDHPGLGSGIQRVVVLGRPTLSRPVSRLLSRDDVEVIVVSARPDWTDATNRAALVAPAVRSARERPGAAGGTGSRGAWAAGRSTAWLDRWRAASRAATRAVDALLDAETTQAGLTGPLVAREVAAALGPGEALVAGSSSAVRDLDLTAHPFPGPVTSPVRGSPGGLPVMLANRGLAGIDGTLSTACGVSLARAAAGLPTPVRVLVGDLAFLHDGNGLLSGPAERRPHVQVVLLDDGGGGIFALLEPGARAARSPGDAGVFERVFATPSGADLVAVCAAVRAAYVAADDVAGLREALSKPGEGVSVVHARVDRRSRRDQARAIQEAVRSAVAAALASSGADTP